MQHHRFPTRLIDWTASFACAAYFAQDGRQPGEDAAIFILNPEGLNKTSIGMEGLVPLEEVHRAETVVDPDRWLPHVVPTPGQSLAPIAVSPIASNPRIIAQRGTFVVAGDSFAGIEDQFDGKLRTSGFLHKIVLPAETHADCQRFVELAGGSPFGYFPDFEGLREEFAEQNRRAIEPYRARSARSR
jgi:hypothetical protein